jgi:cytochrome P450
MLRPQTWWIRPWLYWTTPIRPRLQAIIARAHLFLEPEIDRRRVEGSRHLDMLQWLVDSARGREKSYRMLVQKTLFLCLASVSTSSQAITNVILDLCAHPEHVDPLRDEINRAVAAEGWSLPAIQKMHKLDSLIRESHRYNPSGLCKSSPPPCSDHD